MKKIFLPLCFVFIFLFPSIGYTQSPKEAYRALKKIEARCQTGISYRDYGSSLGDAKFELNMFFEGPEAKDKPELVYFLKEAMKYYEEALDLWSRNIRLRWPANGGLLADKWKMASAELKSAGALIAAYESQKGK
jgi:hypothetical protein